MLHPNLVLSSDDERSLPKDGEGTVDVNELIKRFANDEQEGESSGNLFAQNALKDLQLDEADAECPMCMDVMQFPMIIPECMHRWYARWHPDKLATKHVHCSCKDCIVTYCASTEERGEEPQCPTCLRGPFKVGFLLCTLLDPFNTQCGRKTTSLRFSGRRRALRIRSPM